MRHIFYLNVFIVFGLFFGQNLLAQCGPEALSKVTLGCNLNALSDWDRDRPFNDVFKMNRGFSNNADAPWSGTIPAMDEQGWPTQDFGVIVMVGMDSTMGGSYKIRFEGKALITPIASGFTVQNMAYDTNTNISTANLVYPDAISNGGQMMLGFSNTQYSVGGKGVKHIKIMKPGIPFDGPTFDQKFLDHINRFSTLRLMDWHSTNANADSLWSDRTLVTSPSQAGEVYGAHGIAWEYCIELANLLKKDIWINIPHKATDDYVTRLATLLKNSLDSKIHVYIEYSNEVWNWGFQQSHWNYDQAQIEAIKPGDALNFDNCNDKYTWNYRRIAKRGKEISDLFKTVFGTSEINNHIRVVYAVQLGWFDVGQRGIEFINNYYGAPNQYFYGLAVAPYFNSASVEGTNAASKTDVLDALEADVNNIFGSFNNLLMQYAAITHYYGLAYLSYEGGPDTFGGNNIQSKKLATKDPRMKTICMDYLNRWFSFGAEGLFNWFTAGAANWDTQYGTWSLTEWFENSVKLQAIDETLNGSPPTLSAGFAVPGNIDARLYAGYPSDWNTNPYLHPIDWHGYDEYLILVPKGKAGQYGIKVGMASSGSGQSVGVYLDNHLLQNAIVPNTGNTSTFQQSSEMNADLTEGLHTLRFKWGSTNFVIDSLRFSLKIPCLPTGIRDHFADQGFPIFPNPTSGMFYIDCGLQQQVKLELFNLLGDCIMHVNLHDNVNVLDINVMSKGVYALRLTGVNWSVQRKLIKK